jgi:hypothetical protein
MFHTQSGPEIKVKAESEIISYPQHWQKQLVPAAQHCELGGEKGGSARLCCPFLNTILASVSSTLGSETEFRFSCRLKADFKKNSLLNFLATPSRRPAKALISMNSKI